MSRRRPTIRWRSWRKSGRWWITNGNAQPELFGLSDYFRFVLRAGPDGRSKPFADMYHLAAERLALPLGQILHVGDDLTTDVAAPFAAACRPAGSNRKART
jgi:HAD superfamily hydrolase (TIGR01549 family)